MPEGVLICLIFGSVKEPTLLGVHAISNHEITGTGGGTQLRELRRNSSILHSLACITPINRSYSLWKLFLLNDHDSQYQKRNLRTQSSNTNRWGVNATC